MCVNKLKEAEKKNNKTIQHMRTQHDNLTLQNNKILLSTESYTNQKFFELCAVDLLKKFNNPTNDCNKKNNNNKKKTK